MIKADEKAKQCIASGNSTPFYVYDLNTVKKNYMNLNMAFNMSCTLLYSMKCNPNLQVVKWFAQQQGAMLDASSIQEAKTAMSCGFSPDRISFVGPGKTKEEIDFCLNQKIGFIVIESFSELKKIFLKSAELKIKTKVLVRVAMQQTVSSNGQVRKNYPTQFGVSEDELISITQFIKENTQNTYLEFSGIHCYVQSQYLNVDHIINNFKYAINLHIRIQKILGNNLTTLNLGGGFGVAYFENQISLDLVEFNTKWTALYNQFSLGNSKINLLVESGRYLLANAGFFYTQVLYHKNTYDKNYIICDGGLTQNLMAIGFGQNIKRNFCINNISKENQKNLTQIRYNLAGPSCYSLDILGQDVILPKTDEGDLIRINNCGAYGPTFSPQDFLSRPHAKEFVIEESI